MRFFCLLLLVSACREPFGTDRHDLVGLRIAAISATGTASSEVQLSTLTIVEGRPWSDAPITFAWHRADGLDEEDIAALPLDAALATGPAPTLPPGTTGSLALIASDGTDQWFGRIELPNAPPPPPEIAGIQLRALPLNLDSLTAEDLPLDQRRALSPGDPIDFVPSGAFARLTAEVADGVSVRWMHTAPGGTFLELDARTTDWVAGSFIADDDEIEERQVGEAGPRTVVGLALDPEGTGGNSWFVREIWVDQPQRGVIVSGRWMATDSPIEGPWIQGKLTADDAAPTGLRLTEVVAATADTDPGTAALNCALPVSGPFDPNWLFEQRCARTDVVGATVLMALP